MPHPLSRSLATIAGALLVLGSCAEDREVSFTRAGDDASIASVVGRWTNEADGVTLTLCDDAEQMFCAMDHCHYATPSGGKESDAKALPCHDVRRDGVDETFAYESTSHGCDCYGCECFDYRAGFAIRGALSVAGSPPVDVEGTAVVLSRAIAITLDVPERGAVLDGSLDSGRLELGVRPPAPREGGLPATPTVGTEASSHADASLLDASTHDGGDAGTFAPPRFPAGAVVLRHAEDGAVCPR